MGNEAAAMAQGAEQSGEIIHYAATEIAPGIVINMQTMYMTWIAMAIVFVLFFVVSRNPKLVPSGLQNVMEMVIDFLDGMMNQNLGEKGRKYMASFIITLFMFILNQQRNRYASADWCSLDFTDQRHQHMFCTFAVNCP